MKTLRTFARWLYWRTQAYEGDPQLLKMLERVWWHSSGDSVLRDFARRVRPEDRV